MSAAVADAPAPPAAAAAPAGSMLELLEAAIAGGDTVDIVSTEFARKLDSLDTLAKFRDQFRFPKSEGAEMYRTGSPVIYLCGNSLGLQPVRTQAYIAEELDKWAAHGVEGHFKSERPWMTIEDTVAAGAARIVGAASPSEVAVMNSLTTNLHLLMVPFYRPTATRYKILIEAHAFPSDTYAAKSQLAVHGIEEAKGLITVSPRAGSETLHVDDILAAIEGAGESLALVLLPGVQYYTGQLLDIPRITAATHAVGAIAGWDLAHAVGNVPLYLHDWGVDFAAWCGYKYLNSGPGGIAGAFVHDKYAKETLAERPFFAGWWGHRRSDRFKMGDEFVPIEGAGRFQLSNPPVFQTAALRASLDVFDEAGGMEVLRRKSLALTGYLEAMLKREFADEVTIFTPSDPAQRGCQLSLAFKHPIGKVFACLAREGIICDKREPNVVRIAPTPLYNNAQDLLDFVATLKLVFAEVGEVDDGGAASTA